MSAFFESLWNSIFVPGPTPPLLLATNVAFGALQTILFALLLATYSIHFVILSTLCAGLWGAINWFAAELKTAQLQEEAEKRARGSSGQPGSGNSADEGGSGNDTEYEAEAEDSRQHPLQATVDEVEEDVESTPTVSHFGKGFASSDGAVWNTSTAARLAPQGADDSLRKRRSMDEAAELSTDSEWESVEREK